MTMSKEAAGRAESGPSNGRAEPTKEQRAAATAVYQMICGVHISRAVYVVAELGIAELLAGGPMTSAQLAQATPAHEPSLYRVLRLLASLGVLTEHEHRSFSLTILGDRPADLLQLRRRRRQAEQANLQHHLRAAVHAAPGRDPTPHTSAGAAGAEPATAGDLVPALRPGDRVDDERRRRQDSRPELAAAERACQLHDARRDQCEGSGEEHPLWYYVMKEAALTYSTDAVSATTGQPTAGYGLHLGPLGGRIVGEVIIGLLQTDPDSWVYQQPGWTPTLPNLVAGTNPGPNFRMTDFLRFAGVDPTTRHTQNPSYAVIDRVTASPSSSPGEREYWMIRDPTRM
jgi:hypothetical protein